MATEATHPKSAEGMKRRLRDHRQRTLALRRLRSHKVAVVGGCILVISVLSALFAPLLAPYDPIAMELSATLSPPSVNHLLGTDSFGRDILSRIIFGARVSLFIGLISVGWACRWGS
jgi:peptide/nickel transport system permease protein